MSPANQARVRGFISDFVHTCGIEPPLWLILTAANQSVAVSRYASDFAVEPVCSHVCGGGFAAPIIATVVDSNGRSKAARITVERAGSLWQ
jgi:hypothetical protein